MILNIFFCYATVFSGTFDGVWINAILFRQLPRCRAEDGFAR